MDRRTFLALTIAAPGLAHAQTQKPKPRGTPGAKPIAAPAAKSAVPAGVPWTQWGGPHRNFHTQAAGLKDVWPARGPRVIWKRSLGEGYSGAAVEGTTLYTMYGKPKQEVVLAVNAETGVTRWEHVTPMPFESEAGREQGNGPYSTPLIVGDRLFTTGVAGRFQALDKNSGKVLWTQELWSKHGGTQLAYGYASSPIAYRDLIILPVGGTGKGVMAFRQSDGSVAWSRNDFGNAYSSPVMMSVGGLDQIGVLLDGAMIGVNPLNGDLQWQVPFKADYAIAVATPVWGPDNLLFISSEYNAGAKVDRARAQRPADDGDGTVELEPPASPPRQRHPHRRRHLLLERRQGIAGDPQRGRGAQRQDPLAGTKHRKGDVRVGGREADHAVAGRHADDRVPFAAGLQDRGPGAAAVVARMDRADARWHAPVPSRSAEHDGGGSRVSAWRSRASLNNWRVGDETIDTRRMSQPAAAAALRVRQLKKTYKDVVAVDGIDLEVRPGECFGLLGPNGAGKTTTIEICEGLTDADSGEVEVLGLRWSTDAAALRQRLGIQLQETQLADKLTVAETVRLFRSFYDQGPTPAEVVALVQLEEKQNARVVTLSGGQKQRLALACALVGDPDLLFLDEPTTGLDPQARRQLWDLVDEFKRAGRTILLTTHYMDEAERLCDRVAIVDRGKVISLGTPAELIGSIGVSHVVELATDGAAGRVDLAALRAIPGVDDVREEHGLIRIEAIELHRALPALLEELRRQGTPLSELRTHSATLEDVFVSLTGRHLRDE